MREKNVNRKKANSLKNGFKVFAFKTTNLIF